MPPKRRQSLTEAVSVLKVKPEENDKDAIPQLPPEKMACYVNFWAKYRSSSRSSSALSATDDESSAPQDTTSC